MVDDHASRLDAARAGTGVPALLIGASFVLPTVRTESALGSTERRRSEELGRAGAHRLSI